MGLFSNETFMQNSGRHPSARECLPINKPFCNVINRKDLIADKGFDSLLKRLKNIEALDRIIVE